MCENPVVGVEDRDWYRDEPSREWKRTWGKRPPRTYSRRRYRRRIEKLALPIAVGALCVLGWEYRAELTAAAGLVWTPCGA